MRPHPTEAVRNAAFPPSQTVAQFVATTRYRDLPCALVRAAKKALLDTIGVGLAGVRSEGSAIVRRYLSQLDRGGGVTVFGTPLRLQAALANCATMHADEYDDTFHPSRVHTSAPGVAAVLAEAERGGASGKGVLTAFVVGTEVTCKISQAIDGQHYQRVYRLAASTRRGRR